MKFMTNIPEETFNSKNEFLCHVLVYVMYQMTEIRISNEMKSRKQTFTRNETRLVCVYYFYSEDSTSVSE